MFRLAHISDPHLGPLPKMDIRQLASKRITGYVNWRINRHRNHASGTLPAIIEDLKNFDPSHIAVTGDLINVGLESEVEEARNWLEKLGSADFVSVVPGNHDAYVPGAFARCCDRWAPWMTGDDQSIRADRFPYLRIRDNVALIGVSSARATAPFMATGYFRQKQALALSALLDETRSAGLCRVIIIHHPPVHRAIAFHKRLIGIDRFQRTIKRHGAELILHGHTHLPTLHHLDGNSGKVPVVGVAAAGQAPGGLKPPAQHNLIEISGSRGQWRIILKRRGLGGATAGVGELSAELLTGQ